VPARGAWVLRALDGAQHGLCRHGTAVPALSAAPRHPWATGPRDAMPRGARDGGDAGRARYLTRPLKN
jgi:hypothetical protein